jgi:energy-coupling factor transporter ATP-binding protein EcfA2
MSHSARGGPSRSMIGASHVAPPAASTASSSLISSAASWMMSSVPHAISSVSSRFTGPQGPNFDRDLDRLYHVKIRPLLDAVDLLRGVLREEHSIQLPTIVVVGDQSSGKSSVLEALSGVALPRGKEITTRCPLVLRLINTAVDKDGNAIEQKKKPSQADLDGPDGGSAPVASGKQDPAPYAVISTVSPNINDGEIIHNLADVGTAIERATAKLAGRGIGVVSTPIYLSVFRANSPDLTLVDLPGITRNPVGDQPKDIYKQIKDMIYQFINPETAVILNVMPATVDFTTCEVSERERNDSTGVTVVFSC